MSFSELRRGPRPNAALIRALGDIGVRWSAGCTLLQLRDELQRQLPGKLPCDRTMQRYARRLGLLCRQPADKGCAETRHRWSSGATPAERICARCGQSVRQARRLPGGRTQRCQAPPDRPPERALALLLVMCADPRPARELRADLGEPGAIQDDLMYLRRHGLASAEVVDDEYRFALTRQGEWVLELHWRPSEGSCPPGS